MIIAHDPVQRLLVLEDLGRSLTLADKLFGPDPQAARTCLLGWARRLHFGGVLVNETPTFRADQMPYGGVKDSGNTREGPHFAVRSMTEQKLILVQVPQ